MQRPVRLCGSCGRVRVRLRNRICDDCQSKGRGVGTYCGACGIADPRVLGWAVLDDGGITLCENCTRIADKRRITLAELISEVEPILEARHRGKRSSRARRRGSGKRRRGDSELPPNVYIPREEPEDEPPVT